MNMKNYLVWCEAYGESREDGRQIEAWDGRQACEKWAALDDAYTGSYRIINGKTKELLVLKEGSRPPPKRYSVCGKVAWTYYATELQPDAALISCEPEPG